MKTLNTEVRTDSPRRVMLSRTNPRGEPLVIFSEELPELIEKLIDAQDRLEQAREAELQAELDRRQTRMV